MESFPFPHVLTMTVTLADRTLTVATTVTASTAAPVPLCYGYHPYLQMPGVPREEWGLQTPAMRHLPTDDRGIPTGAHEEWAGRHRNRSATANSTTDSTRCPRVRCSRCPAATGGSRSPTCEGIPPPSSSRRATTTSSASSR